MRRRLAALVGFLAAGACQAGASSAPRECVEDASTGRCPRWIGQDPCQPRYTPQPPPSDGPHKMAAIRSADDRIDPYCLAPVTADAAATLANARASVALFDARDLKEDPQRNIFELKSVPPLRWARDIDPEFTFCADEVFVEQPRGAMCSGVRLADGRVLTVTHCLTITPEAELRFVFGFAMADATNPTSFTFPREDVCTLRPDSARRIADQAVVVEIDCPGPPRPRAGATVATAQIVPAQSTSSCLRGGPGCVYALGYPRRLPLKLSGWGPAIPLAATNVRFGAQIDVMRGNSGSPVFDANHELVGVLVAEGNNDTCHGSCDCLRWRACPRPHCTDPAQIIHVNLTNLPTTGSSTTKDDHHG